MSLHGSIGTKAIGIAFTMLRGNTLLDCSNNHIRAYATLAHSHSLHNHWLYQASMILMSFTSINAARGIFPAMVRLAWYSSRRHGCPGL